MKKYIIFILIGIFAFLGDQLSKRWAKNWLATLHINPPHEVLIKVGPGDHQKKLVDFLNKKLCFSSVAEVKKMIRTFSYLRNRKVSANDRLKKGDRIAVIRSKNGLKPTYYSIKQGGDGLTYAEYLEKTESGRKTFFSREEVFDNSYFALSESDAVTTGMEIALVKREITVIKGFWSFRYAENRGMAFSLLADANEKWRGPFFTIVSVIAILFIFYLFYQLKANQTLLIVAMGLILGGALGNFIDRLHMKYVIDFIDWHLNRRFTWPTFNIADTTIVIGVFFILLDSIVVWFQKKKGPKEKKS